MFHLDSPSSSVLLIKSTFLLNQLTFVVHIEDVIAFFAVYIQVTVQLQYISNIIFKAFSNSN